VHTFIPIAEQEATEVFAAAGTSTSAALLIEAKRVSRSVATGFREHHQERVRTCPGCRRIMAFSDNTRVAKKSDLAGLWEPGGRRSYFRANTTRSAPSRGYSAILAMWRSKPVFGSSDVSSNTLKPSPAISVWR